MEPFQFVAPPRGHAAIRPNRPHQPSPPHRPLDFNIEESAPGGPPTAPPPSDVPRQTMDQEVEEARRAHQLMGPSDGVIARYGVRVLPPRDHRHGWDHPYSRPGGHSGKGGGKSSGRSSKGGDNSGKGTGVSSSSSGQGAVGSPYLSREGHPPHPTAAGQQMGPQSHTWRHHRRGPRGGQPGHGDPVE